MQCSGCGWRTVGNETCELPPDHGHSANICRSPDGREAGTRGSGFGEEGTYTPMTWAVTDEGRGNDVQEHLGMATPQNGDEAETKRA